AFVVKLDTNGAFQWVRQSSDVEGVNSSAVAVDPLGNVYTTGGYQTTATFPDGQTRSGVDVYNQYVLKMDPTRAVTWIARRATANAAEVFGIAADAIGNVYTTGAFSGADVDFAPAGSHATLTSAGDGDVFVSKFNADSSFAWASSAGSAAFDQGSGV